MSCPDNLLIGYRRGALSDEEQARLESHLGGCPTCRLTLQRGLRLRSGARYGSGR